MPITTTGTATDLITFSRGSLATVTDSNGYIKWAPHNLLLASEQFDASNWEKTGATVTANNVASPNGTTTADTLTASAGSSTHCLFSAGVTIQTATNYTYAAFLKKGTHNYATIIALSGTTSWIAITVDFSGSSPVISQTGAGAGGTYVTSGIEAVSNGFYRVWFTASLTVAPVQMEIALSSTATPTYGSYGEVSWSAAGTETIALWGAHLYRSDLGGMQANASAYPYYNPSTPKNLLGFSEAFDNAAWTKTNLSVTANAIAAPNGSLSADSLIENTSAGFHAVSQPFTCVSGTTYAWSAYVKPNGRSIVQISAFATSGIFTAEFTLTGSGSSATIGGSGTASITLVGDGWYRISAIAVATAGGTGYWQSNLCNSAGNNNYTGDGTSGVYLWGAQLSDSASLDPYVGSYGAAPSPAAAYGPRLDYDPSTLAAKGLLVEEQRTNLLQRSAEFDDAYWAKNKLNTTGTPAWVNVGVAPDGTLSAEKLIPNTTSAADHNISSTNVSSGNYTMSIYAKADGYSRLMLYDNGTSTGYGFDLSAGTMFAVSGISAASSPLIVPVGNGWYRCSIYAVGALRFDIYVLNSTSFSNFAGNGTDGVLVWGAQLEAGAFATSYIPTAAATVTRNADVASVATSQFPYSVSEGTLVAKGIFIAPADAGVSVMASLDNGSSGESINIYRQSNLVYLNIFDNSGPAQAQWAVSGTTNLSTAAIAYKTNDIGAAVNGTSQTPDTSATLPTVDRLNIGRMWGGAFGANGHIQQITYIPRRLSSSELVARTA